MSRTQPTEISALAPNEVAALFGHTSAEATLLSAYRSGRLHHALMLCGAPGIGKATLAYRFARFLFEHPDPEAAEVVAATNLEVAPDTRAFRLLSRLAHPDLVAISAEMFDEENRSGEIKVEHVRWAQRKLATASDSGGWRICIVDAADDLNRAAANALLKGLEEPGQRTLFLLVANNPGRLLATIRSRCMRIDLSPLGPAELGRAIAASAPDLASGEDFKELVELANGSPGSALAIAQGGGLELSRRLAALTGGLPALDIAALHELADQLARPNAGDRFELFMGLFIDWLATSVRNRAVRANAAPGRGVGPLEPWLELWDKVIRALDETRVLNLDRKQLILTTFFDLEAAARASAPR